MGSRPQDYRERDLLLASSLRDFRTRLFRRYCHQPPQWVPELPRDWPKQFWRQANQLSILGLMQQELLCRMRTSVDFSADPEQSSTMLDAMDDCMPRGALFERLNDKDFGRSCGYAKLCPWCHARSAQKLYRKLTAGVCSPENLKGKKLVLARVCYRNSIRSSFLDRREVRKTREFYREQARGISPILLDWTEVLSSTNSGQCESMGCGISSRITPSRPKSEGGRNSFAMPRGSRAYPSLPPLWLSQFQVRSCDVQFWPSIGSGLARTDGARYIYNYTAIHQVRGNSPKPRL